MNFDKILGVFSKRHKGSRMLTKPLSHEFKNRVLLLCRDTFPRHRASMGVARPSDFWSDIYNRLEYIHARSDLSGKYPHSVDMATIDFLSQCEDEHFFDFVELIFQLEILWKSGPKVNALKLVEDVNRFFEEDGLPYFLTKFVLTAPPSVVTDRIIYAHYVNFPIEAYPQIICKESEVLHQQAIEPALLLLTEPHFASANEEFLEALKDYRKGDDRDCVAKCGSSFESVMKIICDRKQWPYEQTDTASKLLNTILPQTTLDSFYEQPIMLIATIRNRLSTAHGAGTQQKTIPKHIASYVINATASAILLLVDETDP